MATIIAPPSTSASSKTSVPIPLSEHRPSALGFLDLPPEIRLQIYGYLLRRVPSINFPREYQHLVRRRSAVLSTCRAIHNEATSVLYGKNVFIFNERVDLNYKFALPHDLSEQCNSIFEYKNKDWPTKGPPLLKSSEFACFLNRIGARNAASLRKVIFVVNCANRGSYQCSVVRRLLERHVPDVKFIGFDIMCTIRKEEDAMRFSHALAKLIRGCRMLEDFDVQATVSDNLAGFRKASDRLRLPEAMRVLEDRKERKHEHRE